MPRRPIDNYPFRARKIKELFSEIAKTLGRCPSENEAAEKFFDESKGRCSSSRNAQSLFKVEFRAFCREHSSTYKYEEAKPLECSRAELLDAEFPVKNEASEEEPQVLQSLLEDPMVGSSVHSEHRGHKRPSPFSSAYDQDPSSKRLRSDKEYYRESMSNGGATRHKSPCNSRVDVGSKARRWDLPSPPTKEHLPAQGREDIIQSPPKDRSMQENGLSNGNERPANACTPQHSIKLEEPNSESVGVNMQSISRRWPTTSIKTQNLDGHSHHSDHNDTPEPIYEFTVRSFQHSDAEEDEFAKTTVQCEKNTAITLVRVDGNQSLHRLRKVKGYKKEMQSIIGLRDLDEEGDCVRLHCNRMVKYAYRKSLPPIPKLDQRILATPLQRGPEWNPRGRNYRIKQKGRRCCRDEDVIGANRTKVNSKLRARWRVSERRGDTLWDEQKKTVKQERLLGRLGLAEHEESDGYEEA
ncbi:MAG: hypothetical protein M1820_000006 [Bogoriella megaspora]|nr:MAG: hypothetical protein M1820_000006 [Bogoriella megaspora]